MSVIAGDVLSFPSPALPPPSLTQPEPVEQVHGGTSPFLGAKAAALCVTQQASARINGAWKSRAHALVESSNSSSSWWESRKQRRSRVAANGGGVEVACAAAKGIGKMAELHTLGVVNIAGGRAAVLLFIKELKKLTHLRKLGLSGINHKNWKDLCLGISGRLPRLESLSLQLLLLEEDGNYDFACFDDISELPKTLKSLKVFYTGTGGGGGASPASIRTTWINQFPNLKRFNHEIDGLESIRYLKEVFVTGPCSDGFKEELQKQLGKHEGKPTLRLLSFVADQ